MIPLVASVALTFVAAPAAASGAQDFDELEQELRSQYDDRRERAVRGLGELGTEEAWELVLGALDDPSPRVADQAQARLGSIRDPEVLERLYGRDALGSRDEWVRRRVAEAIGRVAIEVDGDELRRHLDDRDPAVRRALAWSLERLARAGRLGGDRQARIVRALEDAAEDDRDPEVRAAALSALGAVDPEAGAALALELLDDDDDAPARVSALALLETRPDGAEILAAHAGDEAWPVRAQAIESLARLGTRAAARALVDRLEVEERLRLRWWIVESLQEISGLGGRLDPRPWRRWADGLPEGWTSADRRLDRDYGETKASFAGLPVLSDRIRFLVDFSGSLWMEREDGRTRKEVVDVEVAHALESLPADTRFNVVPYTGEPIPWEDRLREASPSNVRAAIAFFEDCKAYGKGDFWGAAMHALEDPETDTIVMLGDGAPSGGRRWNLDLMVPLLAERNRYRKVAFESVLVDASGRLVARWHAMATQSRGRSITRELGGE